MQNPFVAGNSVDPRDFVGRTKEVRCIVSRVSNKGQSVAVVGDPRIGKTSLLRYIAAPEKRLELYGNLAERLIFQYIDATTFSSTFTQAQFWRLALTPLVEKLPIIDIPSLTAAYNICEREDFGVYVLEKLFTQLRLAGWRVVLMLDEFDNLLDHPVLNRAEFYGGLRSLDTRCEAIALVIASRHSIEFLNSTTQEFSRMGSPYFNHMIPVCLGAFTDKEIKTLLSRGSACFKKVDKEYLNHTAGGHPFLLQSAAYTLWEAYMGGETNRKNRWETTAHELLDTASPILADTWRLWSPETRQAITIIALDTLPQLVKGRDYNVDSLIGLLDTYTPEVDELIKRGLLATDNEHKSSYRLQAEVMLWWLTKEMIRVARSKDDDYLSQWERDQQLDSQIKGPQKNRLQKAFSALGPVLKKGTSVVLEVLFEAAMGKFMTP